MYCFVTLPHIIMSVGRSFSFVTRSFSPVASETFQLEEYSPKLKPVSFDLAEPAASTGLIARSSSACSDAASSGAAAADELAVHAAATSRRSSCISSLTATERLGRQPFVFEIRVPFFSPATLPLEGLRHDLLAGARVSTPGRSVHARPCALDDIGGRLKKGS